MSNNRVINKRGILMFVNRLVCAYLHQNFDIVNYRGEIYTDWFFLVENHTFK